MYIRGILSVYGAIVRLNKLATNLQAEAVFSRTWMNQVPKAVSSNPQWSIIF